MYQNNINQFLLLAIVLLHAAQSDAASKLIDGNSAARVAYFVYFEEKLFSYDEIDRLLVDRHPGCEIASYADALTWLAGKSMEIDTSNAMMWVSPPSVQSHNYRWYVAMRTGQLLEYGQLALSARLLLRCDESQVGSASVVD